MSDYYRHEHLAGFGDVSEASPELGRKFTTGCLEKGADLEQMTEAMNVAVAIRGGASLVHGMQMREIAQRKGM